MRLGRYISDMARHINYRLRDIKTIMFKYYYEYIQIW
jgi:hypothetical protein